MTYCNSKKRFILMLEKPCGKHIVAKLYDGAWIGVMEDKGEWLRVITTDGYGWIKANQTREGSGFQLRMLPGTSKPAGSII